MEISHPNMKALSPEEQQNLNRLKSIIEKSVADGVLTTHELEQIATVMGENHHITPQELQLVHTLIREKINRGELVVDRSFDL
ncbi:hypothetical protein [Nodosilinea sp. E11]|uniref:hypothetical protein n=1 Tax=Nodosilinea sp. E11 TaxID=3037479 RepID=UPI0029346B9F|nr:hypothetical protein [Nodosilinea sp. E11]WOD37031.1 hypothetical protein RRF56_00810 [Nodosilinea sp. E11]